MVNKLRVLISKIGLDGHERGAKVVASLLREAGMEVVYLGTYQTPENIVRSAIQEDVDVIGISILSGEHLTMIPELVALMGQEQVTDKLLVVGGVIPVEDVPLLKANGVDEVFAAGTLASEIVAGITAAIARKRGGKVAKPA